MRGLAGAQAEVDSARAQVNFAVKHWRSATDNQNWAAASTWEQKVKEAEQKVKKAKEEVQEAQQKVREAEQKVEKAKEEVEKAKQEVKEAVQKVKEVALCCHALSVALLLSWAGVRRHQGGSFVWFSFGEPRFLPVLAYPGILSSLAV